jgi:O-phosphoseryl-tRNA(Cys) synthetase
MAEEITYRFKPLPANTPRVFDAVLADYRHGTIDGSELQKRIADAIKVDPGLAKFKEEHLAWTDFAHQGTVEL